MQPINLSPCSEVNRRGFLASVAAIGAGGMLGTPRVVAAAPSPKSVAETAVSALYDTLTEVQKKTICFDWDYKHPERGLLRTHVSNFWHITKPVLTSSFYTKDQQVILFDIFKGIFNPDWHDRFVKQLKDDHDGKPWGTGLSCAVFGKPGTDKFEFVMTGRHITIRADGNSAAHVALGGPIFHGHEASGFNEKVHHPGNIFWHQAELANKVYTIFSGKQQAIALVERRPKQEFTVPFQGTKGKLTGLPCSEMSKDQREALEKVLLSLIEPYRKEDQEEVKECLKKQGGLDKCTLTFFKDGDIGEDGEWDNWRLEGPAFVWYFRGQPHVHIWINVADDSEVELNAKNF
ncbi:MAG: DUF3500 domain-containing protein [Planctomycetes bacterium]|nr:DUF3500 domain-containing protein [Planctomycetota bacterium]